METSLAQILGLVLLVNTNLAIIICFATPYWVKRFGLFNSGIWADCANDKCQWVFEDDFFLQRMKTDWFKAVQGLMSAGLGLGLIALLVTTLSLCCRCNPRHAISGLMLTSSVSMAVGLIVFGIKANGDWGIEMSNNTIGEFGWSFYVGIGAAGLALITSFVYCCMSRRPDQYS
ncbi:hypothetical protein ACF0H5_023043 [Mactra antiquata]